ncbi:hypothetical protein EUA03_17320 [Mycolicibacterium mucogenicum]|uniref:Uncharacterized protein n=1 Tax=Mycolicibacterium mucogenicum TaxID=56689 RepID=A0A4R5WEZ5_MYCMU|nr:hypothetical protein EUA03_17320 [Mycolicibacterium mucogenicum]
MVLFVVIGVACLVVFVVVMVRRRGGKSGPSYPVPPQQGYPGYPPQGYPGYPPTGYPNQGYPPNPDDPNSPG